MKRAFLSIFVFLAMVLLFQACKKDVVENQSIQASGYVQGSVISANQSRPVLGAIAKITYNGEDFTTYADNNGRFLLNAPEGEHILHVFTGEGQIFNLTVPVTVAADDTVNVGTITLEHSEEVNLAYLPDLYDHIEHIVIDSLGHPADVISVQTIDIPGALDQYDIVFLNCGDYQRVTTQTTFTNLEQYLLQGGNIYASDYAVGYINGAGYLKTTETLLGKHAMGQPCGSGLIGGFIEDSLLCTSNVGPGLQTVTANVVSPAIQPVFGNSIDIYYDLDQWNVINYLELTDPRFEVLIEDPATYGPLVVKIDMTPGTPGGNIIFTTFHNEANATPDMMDFLEWVIYSF